MTSLWDAHFYGILDAGYISSNDWLNKSNALIEGGADLVEFRAKEYTIAECIRVLDTITPLFTRHSIPLIVNDHLDLALSYPSLGLHIGQDDVNPRKAREVLGPERILGLSTHSLEQVKDAIELKDTLSYFAVGPVYATQTKPTYKAVGLELLEEVARLNPPLPFFAIGGINRHTITAVKRAGANRVVVVSDALSTENTSKVVKEIRSALVK